MRQPAKPPTDPWEAQEVKAAAILLLVLLIPCVAIAADIQVSADRVSIGAVQVETLIDDVKFVPAETKEESSKLITFSSGEKALFLFDDPIIRQEYEIVGEGLKDTVYLKEPRELSYRFRGCSLSLEPDGSVKVDTGDADKYLVMLPATGTDAGGKPMAFDYAIEKDTVRVIIPKDAKYPIVVDPIIEPRYYLKLLLHNNIEAADGFSTSVIRDSSPYLPKMPTFSGGSTLRNLNTTSPLYGNSSAFLRDEAYISVPDSDDFYLGSNNFTICTAVLWGGTLRGLSLFNQTQSSSVYQKFYVDSGAALYWSANNGAGETESATYTFAGGYVPVAGKWYDFCAIKNGSAINLTMNSSNVGTGTMTTITGANVNAPVIIGQNFSTASDYRKIDEVRVFNGWAAPVGSPLLSAEWPLYVNATPQLGYADDNSTIALLHFDGSDGGTLFRDEVGNRSWTATGGAVLATNTSKFSPSALFTVGSGRYISTTNTTPFNYGSSDFTEEIWFNASAYPAAAGYLWSHINSSTGIANNQSYARLTAAGRIRYGIADNGGAESLTITSDASQPAPLNVWNHVAIVRNGTSVKMYLNGTETASGTYTGTMPLANSAVTIGGTPLSTAYSINGWLDEFRATSGYARWTGNFTPPTYAYGLTAPAFSMNKTESGTVPVAVQFTDDTPDSDWTQNGWYWDFGDGSTSTEQNPSHTYTTAGTYNPTLQTLNNNMTTTSAAQTFIPGKPVIDVSVSPSSGTAALLTTITVQVSNQTPINSWNWSYGDGYTDTETPTLASGSGSSTVWTKQHVYASFGYFNLTVNCSNSIGVDDDYTYVTVSTEQNPPQVQSYPQYVTFEARDGFGLLLDEVNITAVPVSTSTGNYDWIVQLIGIPLDEVPIENATLTALTGTDGTATFYVIPTNKYNFTFEKSGYTFTPMIITPVDRRYTVFAQLNLSQVFGEVPGGSNISVTTEGVKINSTAAYVNWTLVDTENSITGGIVEIIADNLTVSGGDRITVAQFPITGSLCNNSTVVPIGAVPAGYQVKVNATSSLEDDFVRLSGGVTFSGHVEFLGFDSQILVWLSMFVLLVVALCAGVETGAAVSLVVCFLAWIFYLSGWLDELATDVPGGMPGVGAALTIATVLSIFWIFREAKRKEVGR